MKTGASQFFVYRITKPGYGNKPGQLPSSLKDALILMDDSQGKVSKIKAATEARFIKSKKLTVEEVRARRCKYGVPFTAQGFLKQHVKADYAPTAGDDVKLDVKGGLLSAPLYLMVLMEDGMINAYGFSHLLPGRRVKLMYLCSVVKGAGKHLMTEILKPENYLPDVVRYIELDDDSGLKGQVRNGVYAPGYYSKLGFRVIGNTGDKYLHTEGSKKGTPKVLNVYGQPIGTSKASKKSSFKPSVPLRRSARVVQTRRKPTVRYALRTRKIYKPASL